MDLTGKTGLACCTTAAMFQLPEALFYIIIIITYFIRAQLLKCEPVTLYLFARPEFA